MIDDCVHKFYETANERKVVGRSDPKNVYTYCENGNKSLRSIALVRSDSITNCTRNAYLNNTTIERL